MGDRFLALKGFRPHGLTTRFLLFMTTSFGRLLSGWPHCVFSLLVFCLRLLPPSWWFDRFLGDHIFIFEVRVLTTFLTIVRCGLHGNSSTREHENVRFGWQNSTKKHYLALEKHKNRSWGGRGRKFKSYHSNQKFVRVVQILTDFSFCFCASLSCSTKTFLTPILLQTSAIDLKSNVPSPQRQMSRASLAFISLK